MRSIPSQGIRYCRVFQNSDLFFTKIAEKLKLKHFVRLDKSGNINIKDKHLSAKLLTFNKIIFVKALVFVT